MFSIHSQEENNDVLGNFYWCEFHLFPRNAEKFDFWPWKWGVDLYMRSTYTRVNTVTHVRQFCFIDSVVSHWKCNATSNVLLSGSIAIMFQSLWAVLGIDMCHGTIINFFLSVSMLHIWLSIWDSHKHHAFRFFVLYWSLN